MKYIVVSPEKRFTATEKKAMTRGFRKKLDFVAGNLPLTQHFAKADLSKTVIIHTGSSEDVMRTYDEVPALYDCNAVIGITALSTNLKTKSNFNYLLSSHYNGGGDWTTITNSDIVEEAKYLAEETDFCIPTMIGGKSISKDFADEDIGNLAVEYKQYNEFAEITVKDDIGKDAVENPEWIFNDSHCVVCHNEIIPENRNLYYTAFEMGFVPASHANLLAKRKSLHAIQLLHPKTQKPMAYMTPDMMRVCGFDIPDLGKTTLISLNREDRLQRQFMAVRETVDYWIHDPDWNEPFESFGW